MDKLIRKIQTCLEKCYSLDTDDIRKLIEEIEKLKRKTKKQEIIIDLMAVQLSTPIHDKEWIIEHYKEEAKKIV